MAASLPPPRKILTYVSKTFTKSILLLLALNTVTGIIHYMFSTPPALHQAGIYGTIEVTAFLSVVHILSPVAGYLGDMKYSRFGILKCGAYFMIAAILVLFILCTTLLTLTVHSPNSTILVCFLSFCFISIAFYQLGYLLFSANFVQFSTDQLRDAPTQCSVIFLYAMLWSNNFSKTISASVFVTLNNETITVSKKPHIELNFAHDIVYSILFGLILLSFVIAILVIRWKEKWFLTEKIRGNPYKLIVKVLMFALRHKSPIRRSAFTFCENERPSRIDFSKRRYGGPYTTEQVEDVKVLLNIVKVLVAIVGPATLLDYAADISSIATYRDITISFVKYLRPWIFSPSVISSLIVIFTLPFYVFLLKPLLERCVPKLLPSFFKRMGLSIFLLTVFFIVCFIYDGFAYDTESSIFEHCPNNRSSILNWNYVHVPQGCLTILQATLLALSHILLNISVWEFICCQSPQHMKGLLFGLLLAIRAVTQFLAALIVVPFLIDWESPPVVSCRTGYSLLHIIIGAVALMLFGITAKRYKYRKRDDICNFYTFAEDYYSK